ncbi:MAG: DUF5666 domain-containing protein [Anaerolineaceae bacterium]|nr:DUF5666 domain-containing protein [Anaerolineaceae bacterium]
MKHIEINDLLEECLRELQAGATLEAIVSTHAEYAPILLPLLETWVRANSLTVHTPPSPQAQAISRTRFLTAAAAALNKPARNEHPFWTTLRIRQLAVSFLLIAFIAGTLFVTGSVSAQALPGDALYPLKRVVENTRLRLVRDPASRLHLEESFDQQRASEAARLLAIQRQVAVSFAGFLTTGAVDASWQVAGISVIFPSTSTEALTLLKGSYVEVQGYTAPGTIVVERIQLRQFHITGTIENKDIDTWMVSGVPITVSTVTSFHGEPTVGSRVEIIAIRPAGDRLFALTIKVISKRSPLDAGSASSPTAILTHTPQIGTITPARTPTVRTPTRTASPETDDDDLEDDEDEKEDDEDDPDDSDDDKDD